MPSQPFASALTAVWLAGLATLAASVGLAVAARADQAPQTLPTRDVDVSYEVSRPGVVDQGKLSQRIRWAFATQQLRIDPPSPGLYVVMDYRTHLLSAVRPAERLVLQIHSDGAGLSMPGAPMPAGQFERRGDDTVVGLACVEWQTRDSAGEAARVCLTADGVLLRAQIGQLALVQATRVAYGPIAPDLFTVPAGFRRVVPTSQPPTGQPGVGPQP